MLGAIPSLSSRAMETVKRAFSCDGEAWLAWISGSGAYGTGPYGLGHVKAVHFARASEPDKPVCEALLETRDLDGLFDDELIALFRGARPVVDASQLPESARRKGRTRSLQDHGPPPGTGADEL
jgi:hypothetical protein